MNKHWKPILIILVVFAGLGWFALDMVQERAAMTASAPGTVTRAAFDPDEESSSLDETDIDYLFEANGRKVAASTSLPGNRVKDYPVGRTVAVCYQPDAPATSRIDSGGDCGG